MEELRKRAILHRANQPELWQKAEGQGYGGVEVDLFQRQKKILIGHPTMPVFGPFSGYKYSLDDFFQWFVLTRNMVALLDLKDFAILRILPELYERVLGLGLSERVIFHSDFKTLQNHEGIFTSTRINQPDSDFLFKNKYRVFTVGWLWMPGIRYFAKKRFCSYGAKNWIRFMTGVADQGGRVILSGPRSEREYRSIFGQYILESPHLILTPKNFFEKH